MHRRLAAVTAVACLMLVTAGCSLFPKHLDTKGLEPTLASQLDSQFNTTGTTVSCPTGVKAEAGETFDCTATFTDGTTVTIRVTQVNADGQVTWKAVGASPSPSP
jgi:uncharacterized protein DUF4333